MSLCEENSSINGTFGERVSKEFAQERLSAFLEAFPNDEVIGYYFDLQRIKEFIADCDAVSSEIVGLRIYNCLNPDSPHPDKKEILIMPVAKKNQNEYVDLYQVYENKNALNMDDDLILAQPLPCPNFCPTNKFKFVDPVE